MQRNEPCMPLFVLYLNADKIDWEVHNKTIGRDFFFLFFYFRVVFRWIFHDDLGHAMRKCAFGSCMWGQWRPRSDCADAQSDQGLHCPLTESLDTTECMNGEQRHGWYFAHAQDDLKLRILCMFEDLFRLTWPICLSCKSLYTCRS